MASGNFRRKARLARTMGWVGLKALVSNKHPILVHMIPMRRCNLDCTYCNEYDKTSDPVPLEEMYARVDKLAELGASIVTLSGGEPLMHPDLDDIIERIASHGIVPELLTNAFFLTEERIKRLNAVGLSRLQISIDNVNPDETSKKSLKTLDRKLVLLSEFADFPVNINSVVGGGIDNPEDALTIAKRARELGFSTTVGIIHDGDGQLKPLGPKEREVYDAIKGLSRGVPKIFTSFQNNLVEGKPNEWRCRAGARYMYICEKGLVHRCSQQRGMPAKPLLEYGPEDIEREYYAEKECAPNCTVSCVHTVAPFDAFRGKQGPDTTEVWVPPEDPGYVTTRPSLSPQPPANAEPMANEASVG